MIEIFSHDVSVSVDPDAEDVLIISGKGWENEPFKVYLNEVEAQNLAWQLNFFVSGE